MREHYTYHRGKHLPLIADKHQYVSRAPLHLLDSEHGEIVKRLSAHSTLLKVPGARRPESLSSAIEKARDLGYSAFPNYLIPDYDDSPDGASPFRITNRIFVIFKQPMSGDAMSTFNEQYGTSTMYSEGDNTRYVLRTAPHVNPLDVVRELMEDDDRVELAEHDVNHRVGPQFTPPTDPKYRFQWHLHDVTNDSRVTPAGSIHAEEAWKLLDNYGDREVVIAVVDFGFDLSHPDLAGDKIAGFAYFVRYNDEKNELISSDDPSADREQLKGNVSRLADHGTACAALAAAAANGKETVGVAPNCRLYPVRLALDGRPGANICDLELIEIARHLSGKVDIVTSSWALTAPQAHWTKATTEELSRIATTAGRRDGKGIVFFWGAGNFNRPLARSFTANVPIPYDLELRDGKFDRFLKARTFSDDLVGLPNVIHVAASTSDGKRAQYSNYGYGIGLTAPSNNADAFGCSVAFPSAALCTSDIDFGGTSAAAPIAAGVAALVISANSDLTAEDTVSILKTTAEQLQLDRKTQLPRAKFNHLGVSAVDDVSPVHPFDDGEFRDVGDRNNVSRSHWFGFGRVDAYKAVQEALKRNPAPPAVASGTSTKVPVSDVAAKRRVKGS